MVSPASTPRVSDSIRLWWGQRICVCNNFQVMLLLVQLVWGPHFENYCFGSSGYQPVCGLAVFKKKTNKKQNFYFISLEFKCWF